MKKTISLILVLAVAISALTALSSCGYAGKEIAGVEYEVDRSFIGPITRTLDLESNTLTVSENILEEIKHNEYTIDRDAVSKLPDILAKHRLTNLLPSYRPLTMILDGSSWTLTIRYKDGTSKVSTGYMAGPYERFRSANKEFYDLTGQELFGELSDSYKYAPFILTDFKNASGDSVYRGNVSFLSCLWRGYKYGDEAELTSGAKEITLPKDTEVIELYATDESTRFINVLSAKSYSPDGSEEREVDFEFNKYAILKKNCKISFTPEKNRIYLFEIEFFDGTAKYAIKCAE